MSILEAAYIETQIDVSNNPEMMALASEGCRQEVITACATQLGVTRQFMTREELEAGDMRTGHKPDTRDRSQCKCYKRGTPEGDAYLRSIGLY
jgi:hypothetical protein